MLKIQDDLLPRDEFEKIQEFFMSGQVPWQYGSILEEHQRMVDSLRKGYKIVTNGGIFGTIVKVGDDRLTLEIASKIQIQLERHQVSRMDKKTGVNKDDDEEEKEEIEEKKEKKTKKGK